MRNIGKTFNIHMCDIHDICDMNCIYDINNICDVICMYINNINNIHNIHDMDSMNGMCIYNNNPIVLDILDILNIYNYRVNS